MRQITLATLMLATLSASAVYEQPDPEGFAPVDAAASPFPVCIIDDKAYVTYQKMTDPDDDGINAAPPTISAFNGAYFELEQQTVTVNGIEYAVCGVAPYALSNSHINWFMVAMPIERIMGSAFDNATNLQFISLDCNVGHIDDGAFVGCDRLSCIFMGGFGGTNRWSIDGEPLMTEVPQLESLKAFDAAQLDRVYIVVPDELYDNFKADKNWGQMPCLIRESDFREPYSYRDGLMVYANPTLRTPDYVIVGDEAFLANYNRGEFDCLNCMPLIYSTYTGDFEIADTFTHNDVTYPVTGVAPFSFYCAEVTSITMPDNIRVIDRIAATHARELKELKMGSGIERIGHRAFMDCPSLERVEVNAAIPPAFDDNTAFLSTDISRATLIVPDESQQLYRQAETWCDFGQIIARSEIYGVVSAITDDAVHISTTSEAVTVSGARAYTGVTVIAPDGHIVAKTQTDSGGNAIVRLNRGTYIVTAGTTSTKVSVY